MGTTCLSFMFLKSGFLFLRQFHDCAQLQLIQLQIFSSPLFSSSDKQISIVFLPSLYKTQNSITISTVTPSYPTF